MLVEQIKQRLDIAEVAGRFTSLKPQGKNLIGSCPLPGHDDRSPSFSVTPANQLYYCFGCGQGGDAIDLLMRVNCQDFATVVTTLACDYGLSQTTAPVNPLYGVLAAAEQFYCNELSHHPEALAELHARGVSIKSIQAFRLGLATDRPLLQALNSFTPQLLEQAGLIVKRDEGPGYFNRFRDRVMIPIKDRQGRTIAFGGRSRSSRGAKYINSPESPLFDKGKTLFGIDKAAPAIAQQQSVIVVEGYFDVIALHAAGITHAVAAMGTALSRDAVELLLRLCPKGREITLNLDSDTSGLRAVERALETCAMLLNQNRIALRILSLESAKDAGEFLQQATGADYLSQISHAPTWMDWWIARQLTASNSNDPGKAQDALDLIVQKISQLQDLLIRRFYIHRTAEAIGGGTATNDTILEIETDIHRRVNLALKPRATGPQHIPATGLSAIQSAEAQILRLYLHQSSLRPHMHERMQARHFTFEPQWLNFWLTIYQSDLTGQHLLEQHKGLLSPQQAELLQLNTRTFSELTRSELVLESALDTIDWHRHNERRIQYLARWAEASDDDGSAAEWLELAKVEIGQMTALDLKRRSILH